MSAVPTDKIIDDATDLQKRAADPDSNVWVMASAGTGKTTVLVERFIRLVLSNTAPEKILCLTYTKAAATQMKDRILSRVSKWVKMDDEELRADVSILVQAECTPSILKKARGLLGTLLDTLDRLNIMTIHSFCQSLLARFQIEAGLSGGLEIMEETKSREIFNHILEDILGNDTNPHIENLLSVKGVGAWPELLTMITGNRLKFQALFASEHDLKKGLSQALQIEEDDNEVNLKYAFLQDNNIPLSLLRLFLDANKDADIIHLALTAPPDKRADIFDKYAQIFLRQDLDRRKVNFTKDDAVQSQIFNEQVRLMQAYDKIKSIRTRDMTLSLAYTAQKVLVAYKKYKEKNGILDYQDLIEKTVSLLSLSDSADWIRYKLDGGIDHVLVDEAQDTNPLQWHIIAKLIEEYFSGDGTRTPEDRTLFVVGDTKQSIFGFHGADPYTAQTYHDHFEALAHKATRPWQDVPLNTSFRTAQDILDVVDACSAWGNTKHIAGKPHAGRVELWPLLETEKIEKENLFWRLPTQNAVKAQKQLIEKTADKIKDMLDNRIALPSKNNGAIQPQDILILVQRRTHYPVPLIQALRQRNIPVAGIDSFALTDDIAVQDLLSILRWSIFLDDDLSLAEILKSPFVGWDDALLGKYAINRKGSLWQEVQENAPAIAGWLKEIKVNSRRHAVGYVLQLILEMPCPASPVSGYQAIQNRLGNATMEALEQLLIYARARDIDERHALPFLHHLEKYSPSIKREMEGENARGVRIMTVHGAKGLEAPVVFLIDTLLSEGFKKKTVDLQWLENDEGLLLPLWATHTDDRATILNTLKSEEAQKLEDEYYRLLYVAMTRAKDYLIISGACMASLPLPESWYFKIQEAMQNIGASTENDIMVYGSMGLVASGTTLEAPSEQQHVTVAMQEIPTWPRDEEIIVASENIACNEHAKYIGRQWHSLLERAIDRNDDEWAEFFDQWIEDLPDIKEDIGRQRLNALRQHSQYGFLFQPGGAVEVPFITSGEVAPTRGRIDRLVRTDEALWIIDYKTRLDPSQIEQLAAYHTQMNGYRTALAPISNGLPVKTVLVDIAKGDVHVI